ncbi:MAG: recombination protein RecR [Clostridia bacterium]|nr:recombination protein RecR [Clostridia bacterium]
MAEFIEPLEELIEQFRRLEGIGRKTAVRLAFSVLGFTEDQAADFAAAILNAKTKIHLCPVCQNISSDDLCPVCASAARDTSVICVVEDPRAVLAIEKVKEYRGLYHVLHGAISPMKGIGPDKLKIKELVDRLADGEVKEVILATNPTVEGEATAMYISRILRSYPIKVTRIANGVPVGGDLEYADEVTLFRALQGRVDI